MTEKEVTPEILGVLQSMELFRGKDPDELIEWLGKAPVERGAVCATREFAGGERIVEQGSFGDSFHILVRGKVAVSLIPEGRLLATLGPGSFFGEMTLLSGLPRSANMTPVEGCLTIEVPRRAFELWARRPGAFRDTMDRVYLERGAATHLLSIPEFSELEPGALREVVKHSRLRIFAEGDTIVREGDPGDSLFLIRDGYVRVLKNMAGGEQRTVAYLNDGAYFGESAILRAERRNSTVIAMGKVEAIQVMKEAFVTLVKGAELLPDRLVQIDQKQREAEQGAAGETMRLGFIGQVVERGVVKATSALVIHLDTCTRCGNCVKACAELHGGISRLTRHGMFFDEPGQGPQLVATSCMHCLDPECMIGCPTGAITRDLNGEVVIQDSCIGCGNCARRCPYGNISMAEMLSPEDLAKQRTGAPSIGGYLKTWRTPESEPMLHEMGKGNEKAVVRRIAVKCDLCRDYNYNHGCVHNCPYGSIERMDAGAFLDLPGSPG